MKSLRPTPRIRLASAVSLSAALLCALAWLLPSSLTLSASAQADPTPFPAFVRQIELRVVSLAYSPATQTIFATRNSSVGADGNSVVQINPLTGEVGAPVFVGSEPSQMAFSDDGLTMYVALEGARAVRRFDVATGTPGARYAITNGCGSSQPQYLAVMPGRPQTIAVTRNCGGTVVLDDGVPRPQEVTITTPGQPHFGVSPSRLYTTINNFGVRRYTLSASGLTPDGDLVPFTKGGETQFDRTRGLIFSANGDVINPETGQTVAQLPGTGRMAIDPAAGRVYFLGADPSGVAGLHRITGYDMTTFQPIGYTTVSGVTGFAFNFIRWGSNGFAFYALSGLVGESPRVHLVQTQLVDSSAALPTPTPTPAATPTPTPTPGVPTLLRRVNLRANDLVYNAATQSLYASVPSAAGAGGDSVTPIDPETLTLGAPVAVGSEPGQLALADDGRTLYVHLAGPNAVRRVDLQTQAAGLQFALTTEAADMKVMPGRPETLAVSGGVDPDFTPGIAQEAKEGAAATRGVTLYDDGVARPKTGTDGPFYKGVRPIEFASPSVLYGFNNTAAEFELVKFAVEADGLTVADVTPRIANGSPGEPMIYAGGRLYFQGGAVIDPEAKELLGTFRGNLFHAVAVDVALGRAFFINRAGSSDVDKELVAYDLNTFLPVGRSAPFRMPGFPSRMVRWGANGLAVRVRNSSFNTNFGDVYVIESALVSSAEPIPAAVQFDVPALTRPEVSERAQFLVTRTGDLSRTTTVDYATADGTATDDEDYVQTAGTLTFAPGETSKIIDIPLTQDDILEGNEAFTLALSAPSAGTILTGPASATVNITDDDPFPTLDIADARVSEGHSGTKDIEFLFTLKGRTIHTVTVNFATSDGTATAGSDYEATSGTVTFPPLSTSAVARVKVIGDTQVEPDETFNVTISAPVNAGFNKFKATGTIVNDEGPATVQFSSANYAVDETAGQVVLTVTRSGDLSAPASVAYATSDATASEVSDYTLALGTFDFAAGEFEKSLPVLITDDVFAEPQETLTVTLSSPSGAALGTPSAATVAIANNDATTGQNPIGPFGTNAEFFVRQHYHDFLNREPDAAGLAHWKNEFFQCNNSACFEVKRVNVSAAFFLSIEFQETGYFVYRVHQAAYDTRHALRLRTFLADTQEIGRGVQVGVGDWRAQLDANKQAFVERFVTSPAFAVYQPLSNSEYVDQLLFHTFDPRDPAAGYALTEAERAALIADLDASRKTRADALRVVAENAEFSRRQSNNAFVLMEYFGYLRRNPDDPPDGNFDGYNFWLSKLDEFNGNYIQAEMVKAFINSAEYRRRFGP